MLFALIVSPFAAAQEKPKDAALERARKTTKMLDDLYKTAIVVVTETYVASESDIPAATSFKKLFDTMKKSGYHELRLVDATGEPYEPKNAPADDFEKAAIKAIKGGKATYEQVAEKDGKRVLRTATAVPVVMKKCILCHPAWEDVKPGEAVGAISYIVPIE
jgi:hypothetical protein